MKLDPEIRITSEIHLVGMNVQMSLTEPKTHELWHKFKKAISTFIPDESINYFSVDHYHSIDYFSNFSPATKFTKWAAIEEIDFHINSIELERTTIPAGKYAVFLYHGHPQKAYSFFQYIFSEWLPESEFVLDDRPHFAKMDNKYKNDSDDSKEEIWIPITNKI